MPITQNPFSLCFPVEIGNVSCNVYLNENICVCGEECISKPHSHNFYEIRYCVSGESISVVENKSYILKQGDIFIVKPNEDHYLFLKGNAESVKQYTLRFVTDEMKNESHSSNKAFAKLIKITESTRTVFDKNGKILSYFENVFYEIKNKNYGYINNLKLLSTLLLTELLRCTEKDISDIFPPEDNKYGGLTITKTEQFFSRQYMNPVKIGDLAKYITVSERQCARIIKQMYGLPFSGKLNEIRIKHAVYYLIHTNFSIEKIASLCGYDNSSYFYMVFKEKYGITPKEYRNKIKIGT